MVLSARTDWLVGRADAASMLGAALSAQGRDEEADAVLAEALDLYERKGATVMVDACREITCSRMIGWRRLSVTLWKNRDFDDVVEYERSNCDAQIHIQFRRHAGRDREWAPAVRVGTARSIPTRTRCGCSPSLRRSRRAARRPAETIPRPSPAGEAHMTAVELRAAGPTPIWQFSEQTVNNGVFEVGWARGSALAITIKTDGDIETYTWSEWVWLRRP